jgi:hypothetical protein
MQVHSDRTESLKDLKLMEWPVHVNLDRIKRSNDLETHGVALV